MATYTVRQATEKDAQIIADLFNYYVERAAVKIPTRWTAETILQNLRAPDQYFVIARETVTGKDEGFFGAFHDGPGLPLRVLTAGYREVSHTGLNHPRHYLITAIAKIGIAKGAAGWTRIRVSGPKTCVLAGLVEPVLTVSKPPEGVTYPTFDGQPGIQADFDVATWLKWAKGLP